MGAQIDVYRNFVRTLNGTPKNYGSAPSPLTSFSSFETDDTTGPAHDDSIIVAPSTTKTLWDYSTSPFQDWEIGFVEIAGFVDGQVYLYWQNDTATSSSNNAPTGTARTWDKVVLSGKGSYTFTGRDALTNATPADHASDTAGAPTALTDAGEVAGFIYKVMVKNPGTTNVRIRSVFLG